MYVCLSEFVCEGGGCMFACVFVACCKCAAVVIFSCRHCPCDLGEAEALPFL